MEKSWLVAGDFNDYGSQNDIRSFSTNHNPRRSQKFLDRANNCNLLDFDSTGPKLTWINNRQGLANTMERLDRAMCNEDWRTMFSEAIVQVLPRTYSDHSPLIVHTQGIQRAQTTNFSHNLQALEKDLINQYSVTTFQEEILWFQKSRSKYISLGDKNSRYFHVSTINKRRKLKINALKDSDGNWITEIEGIKSIILNYFSDLFKKTGIHILSH
ncbi:uncharacterized protein LOC114279914 [Camellia sinensis]|uniref:uncharacterized protein LOC114279914 n=1 Tax=Camellia sinensis TaxID=4442 RepID=UPI00103641D1|nr:uncharacterized protein LOC114279914 [Camellia sinensis]